MNFFAKKIFLWLKLDVEFEFNVHGGEMRVSVLENGKTTGLRILHQEDALRAGLRIRHWIRFLLRSATVWLEATDPIPEARPSTMTAAEMT